jgi:hypothetical protein
MTHENKDPRRNASGCFDPTPFNAIKNIEHKQLEEEYQRYRKFIGCIFRIGELSDFYIEDIVVKDKRTGKIRTLK